MRASAAVVSSAVKSLAFDQSAEIGVDPGDRCVNPFFGKIVQNDIETGERR